MVLSSASQHPLVLLSVHASPAWSARSWDRFLLPLPFARVELRYDAMGSPRPGKAARAAAAKQLQRRLRAMAPSPSDRPYGFRCTWRTW